MSRTRFTTRTFAGFVLVAVAALLGQSAFADDTTVSYDNLRTSWDPNESALSPASVPGTGFGQLFSTAVTGQVYGQPLVVGTKLVAVTEANNVYGINAATGAVLWSRNVGAPLAPWASCGDLTPQIGITSSPVYDPATKAVFFVAKVNDGPHYYMHSVDLATGAERAGWPVTIQGAPTNDTAHPFNVSTALQRPGLLLLGGVVYAAFGSSCDQGPYDGYVAGVKTTTPAMSTLWTTEAGTAAGEGAIWQSGGGLISDGPGRIILTTGNGDDPPRGPGNSPPGHLGDSVVRLQVNSDGSLIAKDFFSPNNNSQLAAADADFGSGGPLALPNGFGTAAHPNLLVQVGKDGRVFLLDRDNLGGMGQGSGGSDNSVGPPAGPFKGLWNHSAFWGGDGGYVYDVENGGPLRALKYSVNSSGLPQLTSAGTSSATFALGAGVPKVTSTGSTAGSALVWVVQTSSSSGTGATLQAYDAVPQSGQMHLRFSAPIGTAAKFVVPATNAGRVYVGTRDGHVLGFGPTAATGGGTGPVTSGVAGKCLDDNNSTADGSTVIIYDCNGGANQKWTFSGGTLQIGGKCVDVVGAATANSSKVQLWDCNGGTNQQWTAQSNGELVGTGSGRCLDDPASSTVNGTQTVIWDCNNGANQHWTLPAVATAKIGPIMAGVSATLCIDDPASATANGTPVQLYTCNGGTNQQWTVATNSTLTVLGKCMEISGGGTADTTPIDLSDCVGSAAQVWQPQTNGSLRNPGTGKCLDDPGASTALQVTLQLYTCNGTAAQHWILPT